RHIRGFIHSESSTGQTVYIEPEETLELNNDIISLTFAERREIERILRELTKKIGSYSPQLKTNLSIISYIDSIFAKANYSIESIGSYPQVNNKKPFIILDGRHPILLKKGGKNNTVPLNLNTENQVVIITGPNAGGKTVVLKTIGLLCLMVQSGIHIPANPDSNFHFFKDIYVDIGDEQSIEDDLSTFSSHLSNINKIVLSADTNSLVLVDEIGTGTDPTEGAALAAAMLIKLKEKGAIVFASTHHGSLKIIANELEGFENSAMEFDNLNLKPTYIFKQGVPGSSYAFEIAKRIGFDNNFLSLAENYLDGDKHKLENFLVQIESKSKDLEDKLRKAELESARLSGLTNLYKKNVQKLEDDKRDILKKAKDDAAEYLKDMNRKFEQLVREIKESNANQEVIKQTRKEIHHLTEKNEELVKEKEPVISNEEFILGDAVAIKNTNTSGEIVELTKDGKTAVIKIGTIKMKVPVVNLEHTKKEKIKINYEPLSNYQPSNQQLRLDIRGAKPEEVEFDIIRFIDDAYTSNVERIEILHGKGTGVLKKTVHQILKKHEKVSSFYFAPVEFGGEGITIAELK
ncbi:MAG: endonuclease MutS2, partial [Syntrophothermus sp.]